MGSSAVVAGAVGTGAVGATQTGDVEPTVVFEDQESDGSSVVVAEVATDVDTTLHILDRDRSELLATVRMEAGEVLTDHVVDLDPVLTESRELAAFIIETSDGDVESSAWIAVGEELGERVGLSETLIEADPASGFNYPYYLWAPSKSADADPVPPLVEPVNTGKPSDDLSVHEHAASHTIESGTGRRVASELEAPFIVPIFPRPETEPVDAMHYVHQLDDTTMGIDSGPLERVDRQLLNMVEHAQGYLAEEGYPVANDGIMLNGFSASGNFVDRFTVLHPEAVTSVTAGGLNGMALLPLESVDGQELPYHVGIGNAEELTGERVDLDALDETDQFLYMGGEDDNDTIPFDDAWTDDSLRQLALDVYGEDMIAERFPRCQQAYQEVGVDAQFRIYAGAGHTPQPATDDIVEFHRRSINGESVDDFGQNLGPDVRIDLSPATASVGETIEFDGSDSTAGETASIVTYQWDFGDGSTAVGETVSYAFESEGSFTVRLTIITDRGNEYETKAEIVVGAGADTGGGDDENEEAGATDSGGESDTDADSDDTDADSDDTDADDGGPGFGIGGALAGISGTAYVLRRRIRSEEGSE